MRWKTAEYSGWGRAVQARGRIARPERISALRALMAEEPAPAIGNRRSYGDACLNDSGAIIAMERLDRILSFDAEAGLCRVEAGVTLGELVQFTARRGWLPRVLPGTGKATVGGAIAMDVHGKNHRRAGSFCCHVARMTLITPDGPQDVAAESPLFRATAGGLGQTGVIADATLKLMRCKGDVAIVTERRVADWDAFLALLDRSDASYSVGWVDAMARGRALGRGILEEAEIGAGLVPASVSKRRVPFEAPAWALAPPVIRAFNTAYLRRVPKSGRTGAKPAVDFFFPLDRIDDWNRLYGRAGFHQFQCVVPADAAPALKSMLSQIAASRLASPLAVLKRLGPGRAGPMSFPMDGWTLACDFQNSRAARDLIGRLETDVEATGGRIYLAKDALASGSTIRAMYPEWRAWRDVTDQMDPQGALNTDLVRRLGLRG